MEKHYFAGNNTSVGFYNYFDNIISPEQAERIYILKVDQEWEKVHLWKSSQTFFGVRNSYWIHSLFYIIIV